MIKILVVIANYGMKNIDYLKKLIKEYKGMSFPVDIVVLSEQPKDIGDGVTVKVGLPTKDPWSLPYGHQEVFAGNKDRYDLFIYSEDDILITQKNIESFLNVTQVLPSNKIAGFIRYEIDTKSNRYFSTIHSHWHWEPSSVETIGGYTFAVFSNYHSGCYILTRDQLKRAIQSGGYLVEPHEGRYDLLCSAATDIYTQCGFQKVIPVSHLDDFSLPHLPNVYIGKLGVQSSEVFTQIEALKQIEHKQKPYYQMFNTQTCLTHSLWDKSYYEPAQNEIVQLMPDTVRSVLSIGCGWGEMESELIKKNIMVTGMPIDAVIGSCAEAKGVKLTSPDFDLACQELSGHKFDCLLISNVLQYVPDPVATLKKFLAFLSEEGIVIIAIPNMNHVSVWWKRFFGQRIFRDFKYIGDFNRSGLNFTSFRRAKKWIDQSGLEPISVLWGNIRLTTSFMEKNWFLEGGMQPIRSIQKHYDKLNGMFNFFLNQIFGFFSFNIVFLAKRGMTNRGI